ncbi:SDR family NAD(P)-dependent oxidoreductase [Streptomyces sp. NPDC020951]|uniref:SDR family NAD(P)-dependent oxidoreductase n=1 Tax=Streptomyces sp. NPDC020951 TaxID=3365104 RepID=UPI003787C57F
MDVPINNAASFYAGFFEKLPDAQIRAQIETNLFGPMNVTRAALPVMRAQRAGHVLTLSSLAGAVGVDFCVAYSAAKFGSRASSAPNSSWTPPPPTPRAPSTTTPSAPPRPRRSGPP